MARVLREPLVEGLLGNGIQLRAVGLAFGIFSEVKVDLGWLVRVGPLL